MFVHMLSVVWRESDEQPWTLAQESWVHGFRCICRGGGGVVSSQGTRIMAAETQPQGNRWSALDPATPRLCDLGEVI